MPLFSIVTIAKKQGNFATILQYHPTAGEKYTPADFLAHSGIITMIDAAHAIAHNEVMIIDGETVITGSFNFTKAAEQNNAENLLVIHDDGKLAERYMKNWQDHEGHSEVYRGTELGVLRGEQ
jgi:phosphatidylserine/phosphatidylglycerophosphate/cardiolipin synthase-like enzyme